MTRPPGPSDPSAPGGHPVAEAPRGFQNSQEAVPPVGHGRIPGHAVSEEPPPAGYKLQEATWLVPKKSQAGKKE